MPHPRAGLSANKQETSLATPSVVLPSTAAFLKSFQRTSSLRHPLECTEIAGGLRQVLFFFPATFFPAGRANVTGINDSHPFRSTALSAPPRCRAPLIPRQSVSQSMTRDPLVGRKDPAGSRNFPLGAVAPIYLRRRRYNI